MTAASNITWNSIRSVTTGESTGEYVWAPVTPDPGAQPPPATIAHGHGLQCVVAANGPQPSFGQPPSYYGSATPGSPVLTNVTGQAGTSAAFSDLYVGQYLRWAGSSDGTFPFPNGCQIIAIDQTAQSITVSAPAGPSVPSRCYFYAYSTQIPGTLTATVTPASGVTMTGYNYDGTTDARHTDNGTLMMNAADEADAIFDVMFANPGSYSVSLSFASSDTNFSNATVEYPLLVTAT